MPLEGVKRARTGLTSTLLHRLYNFYHFFGGLPFNFVIFNSFIQHDSVLQRKKNTVQQFLALNIKIIIFIFMVIFLIDYSFDNSMHFVIPSSLIPFKSFSTVCINDFVLIPKMFGPKALVLICFKSQ